MYARGMGKSPHSARGRTRTTAAMHPPTALSFPLSRPIDGPSTFADRRKREKRATDSTDALYYYYYKSRPFLGTTTDRPRGLNRRSLLLSGGGGTLALLCVGRRRMRQKRGRENRTGQIEEEKNCPFAANAIAFTEVEFLLSSLTIEQ